MEPIRALFDRQQPNSASVLPDALYSLYGGGLWFPAVDGRPYTVANFVTTLDGVVSYNIRGKSGGSEISGFNEGDQFIMGLLRASADAIIVGAHTFHAAGPKHTWTADSIYPHGKDLYADYREQILQKPKRPYVVVVSGSGRIDCTQAIFTTAEANVVIVTTGSGDREIQQRLKATATCATITSIPASTAITPSYIRELLGSRFGVQLLLHEGGPTLLGEFTAAGCMDELFLTVSPQMAGRHLNQPRPGLISGVEFTPASAPWLDLLSAKQSGNHLYLRYGA